MSEIQWLKEIDDIPAKVLDPLGEEVLNRFNGAIAWQTTEQVNGKPLRDVLRECWEQQNGVLSCADKERADAVGVDVIVNITALKTGVANAYMVDALTSGDTQLPWIIQPTPRPDIAPDAKLRILDEVKSALFGMNPNNLLGSVTSEGLIEFIRQAKKMEWQHAKEVAEKSAEEMTLLMEDQCAEGGFYRALTDLLQYFPVYPYCVFVGPFIQRAPRLAWGTKKPRLDTEVFPTFRAVSPFDFVYSPDSPDTQRGTCVFTRTHWTRKQLLDASKLGSYITENVIDVIQNADSNPEYHLHWLSDSPDNVERSLSLWKANVSPIEVLTHYGVMSGRELASYGFHHLDRDEFYNCEIAMVGYRVIQVKVLADPRMQTRPVHTASFYRTGGDRIAGDGIAQRVRDIERAYHACVMYLMRNAANSSAPLCEVDYKRLINHLSEEDFAQVVPGLMYMADTDVSHGGNPAMRFHTIPSNIPAYSQLMELFMQLADRITNIPASLHGEAVGSGAMRTFRGMSMLQNNATRALHAALNNLSMGVFSPVGELLYNINMLYSSDDSVKGDSQIVTKGAEGLLKKEMDRQNAMEVLQLLGSVGSQLGQFINIAPGLSWSMLTLLKNMDVPTEVIEQMSQPAPQPMAPPEGGADVAAGFNPNPNPNPGIPEPAERPAAEEML